MNSKDDAPVGALRSAEEIARAMVGEIDVMMSMAGPHVYAFAIGDLFCSYEDPDIARVQREAAIALLARLIEQSRADGAGSSEAGLGEFVASHVEAIDHYREGLHRIWHGAEDPRSIAADYLGEDPPEQPRDLASRIRALVQEYAGRWMEADSEDDLANARTAMQHLRHAYRVARRGFDVEKRIGERLEKMREDTYGSDDPVTRAADELEAIVRECEEKR